MFSKPFLEFNAWLKINLNLLSFNYEQLFEQCSPNNGFLYLGQNLFIRFGISMSFMNCDRKEWASNNDYKIGQELINSLRVVKDSAERGVKLATDI